MRLNLKPLVFFALMMFFLGVTLGLLIWPVWLWTNMLIADGKIFCMNLLFDLWHILFK
jgi:hypothetical protein